MIWLLVLQFHLYLAVGASNHSACFALMPKQMQLKFLTGSKHFVQQSWNTFSDQAIFVPHFIGHSLWFQVFCTWPIQFIFPFLKCALLAPPQKTIRSYHSQSAKDFFTSYLHCFVFDTFTRFKELTYTLITALRCAHPRLTTLAMLKIPCFSNRIVHVVVFWICLSHICPNAC